jgi:hypothetical protein
MKALEWNPPKTSQRNTVTTFLRGRAEARTDLFFDHLPCCWEE